MLSEKGRLVDTPPLRLLLKIFEANLTGILYLKKEETLKVLYFHRGKFTWAISNAEEDRLEVILIRRAALGATELESMKRELQPPEQVGKILVEKGLITLEELIAASREQLHAILSGVLAWRSGTFQFVRDTPPEKLLSLDLDIPEIVQRTIRENLEMDVIWREIGSLQIELRASDDAERRRQYRPSEEQREVLAAFNPPARLESVLSRHSGERSHSLVRQVYYLLQVGLLEKTAWVPPLEPAPAPEPAVVPPFPPIPPPMEDQAPPRDEPAAPTPPPTPPMPTKSRKSNLTSYLWLILGLIFILGSLLLWLLMSGREPHRPANPDSAQNPPNQPIAAEPSAAPVDPAASPGVVPGTSTAGETAAAGETAPPPTAEPKPETGAAPKPTEAAPAKPVETGSAQNPADKKPLSPTPSTGETKPTPPPPAKPAAEPIDPARAFARGDLAAAAAAWKEEIRRGGIRYSIFLELDCQAESVRYAYEQITDKAAFFLLPRSRNGSTCFVVLWGKYRSEKEARDGLQRLPASFWKQSEPPEIVEVGRYL